MIWFDLLRRSERGNCYHEPDPGEFRSLLGILSSGEEINADSSEDSMTSYRHPLHHFQAQEYTIPVILCVSIINFYETIKLHLIFVYFRLSRHFEQFPDHSMSAPRRLRSNKVGFCGYFQLWSYVQIRFGTIHRLQETPWRWRRLWKFLLHFWQGIERNLCVAGTWSCRRKWHGSPAGCISGIRWIFRQPSPQRQGPTEDAIELSSSSVFFFDVGRGGRGATNCFTAARSSITNLAAIPSGVSFCSTTSTASTSTSFSRSTSPAHQYLRRESVRIPSGDMGSATSETILELLKSSSTVLTILSLKPPAPKGLSLQQSLGRRFAWNPPALVTSVHRPHPISPKAHLGCHHFQQRWN